MPWRGGAEDDYEDADDPDGDGEAEDGNADDSDGDDNENMDDSNSDDENEETGQESGTCGENLTWVLTNNGTLTISGTGAMEDYDPGSGDSASWRYDTVNKVVIEDGVTSIGEEAFYDCDGLTEITIPSSVTSIGKYAFSGCDGLTEITIPSSMTSIGDRAFFGCYGLTEITIPLSVTSIGESAFCYCSSLTEITIPSGVTSIGESAFYYCSSLTKVTIPSSVTSIGESAFAHCTSLTEITIPSSVTSIGDALSDCTNLQAIRVESGNKYYTSVDGILYNVDVTELIFCPLGYAQKVKIPSSVTSIGESAFAHCTSLTEITIPSSVTSIGDGAFYDCDGLTEITIPSSVTSIGEYAFLGCNGLTEITIPSSVTSIGEYTFYGCYGLTEITIPSSVTSIGKYAFSGCDGLTEITIPSSVTSIGERAFGFCRGLIEITIPSSVTNIENQVFYGCTNLQSIQVESGNEYYTSIDGVLYNADVTEVICYPQGNNQEVYEIPDTVQKIGTLTILGENLKTIIIPESVTSMENTVFCKVLYSTGDEKIGARNITEIYFKGDIPRLCAYVEVYVEGTFDGVKATVYYPADNDTYSKIIDYDGPYVSPYGGTLTWVAKDYGTETPDTITTSSTDEAVSALTTSNVILTLPTSEAMDETVQKTLFEEAAEHDRTLEFDFYEGEDLAYSWTFDGSTITNPSQTVSLQITIDANNADVTSLVDEGVNQIDYRFLHDGALPGPVEIKVDTKNMVSAGDLYLYYYNPETKALELVADHVPMEGRYATFTLTHCSDYVLSNAPISTKPDEPSSPDSNGTGNDTNNAGTGNDANHAGTGNNANNAGTGNNANHAGAGNDANNAGTGNDANHAGTGNGANNAGTGNGVNNAGTGNDANNTGSTGANTVAPSGQTGDNTPLTLLAVMLCSAIAAMGAVLCTRQKRR